MSNVATLNRKGRRPGATNLATRERQARETEAVRLLADQIGAEAVANMTALEIVRAIMLAAFHAGDMAGALTAATVALPYTSPRLGAIGGPSEMPAELMPDPEPIPDEPGPPVPVY